MQIQQDYDLTKLNTLGIKAIARLFVVLEREEDLVELFASPEFQNNKKFFLGGGSNVLFTKDFDGIVILNKLKGIKILEAPTPQRVGVPTESVGKDSVYIRAMGGEVWHDLVSFAVERGLWGIENLSLIPGTVGAAPMQNIGAYGAELKDVLTSVEAYDLETGEKKIFTKEECELGYRDSIFKNRLKDKYFISAVTLKLSKIEKKNLDYRVLQEHLAKNKIEATHPRHISDAVVSIRQSKLPDPAVIGNAGSFFKNVFLTQEEFNNFQSRYPDVPHFEEDAPSPLTPLQNLERGRIQYKIPAAWLIEQCNWKGKRVGNVGVHEKQALVLVNYGGAKGVEVKNLAEDIINSVFAKFGLTLIPEVNLI